MSTDIGGKRLLDGPPCLYTDSLTLLTSFCSLRHNSGERFRLLIGSEVLENGKRKSNNDFLKVFHHLISEKKSRFVFYSCFPLPPPVPVLFPILPGSCPLSPLPHTRLVFPKKCFQGYPLKTFLRTRKSISMKLLNTQHSSIPLMNVTLFYKQLLSVFFINLEIMRKKLHRETTGGRDIFHTLKFFSLVKRLSFGPQAVLGKATVPSAIDYT